MDRQFAEPQDRYPKRRGNPNQIRFDERNPRSRPGTFSKRASYAPGHTIPDQQVKGFVC
jgi:hypothetical protein